MLLSCFFFSFLDFSPTHTRKPAITLRYVVHICRIYRKLYLKIFASPLRLYQTYPFTACTRTHMWIVYTYISFGQQYTHIQTMDARKLCNFWSYFCTKGNQHQADSISVCSGIFCFGSHPLDGILLTHT